MNLPPEIETKIAILEKENKQLRTSTSALKASASSAKSVSYFLGVLVLFAIAFITWLWRDEGVLFRSNDPVVQDTIAVETEKELPEEKTSPWNEGLYFCVQIGAYKNVDLSLYSETYAFFRYHLDNNLYKYTLGIFSSYEQAHVFRSEMLRLGLDDAFVQAIHNGAPIGIEKALEMSK